MLTCRELMERILALLKGATRNQLEIVYGFLLGLIK